jgi:hypothetical protein
VVEVLGSTFGLIASSRRVNGLHRRLAVRRGLPWRGGGMDCSGSRSREGRSSAVRGGGETEDGRLGHGRKAEDLDLSAAPRRGHKAT